MKELWELHLIYLSCKISFTLGILLLIGGIALGLAFGWWEAAIVLAEASCCACIVTHYSCSGLCAWYRKRWEAGDVEGAMRILNSIQFPKLLYKPIRSGYYLMQSNLAMQNEDLDKAESAVRASIKSGSPTREHEGMQYFQLGIIASRKNDSKTASENLRRALKLGLPDKENTAAALLQLCSISMSRRILKLPKSISAVQKSRNPLLSRSKARLKKWTNTSAGCLVDQTSIKESR